MSQKVRNSSSKLLLVTRKKTRPRLQQISYKGFRLLRNGKQKCLECKGIPRLFVSLDGFQPTKEAYRHKPDCSQKDLF